MRRLLALALAALLTLPASAQDMATLIADSLAIRGDNVLVAEGGVEVFYQGRRLKAAKLSYDQSTDKLTIEGPITLTDGDKIIVLAEMAELSGDLTQGILTSARMVLNQQLQLAADEILRVNGRYTQLSRTVASSCQVCPTNPTPLWEIRARRVIHDQLERQLYFDGAQFRIMGVPVAYIPHLRMPDPTLDRATGFLMPEIRTTSTLGTGIKLPYFIALGDHRDLTLTPYLSTNRTRTLEARYRQAFRNGQIEAKGALSWDDILPGEQRGYLTAQGSFELPRDFDLGFNLEMVSDPAYLLDYGLSQKDRLDSRIEVTRTRRNEYIGGRLIHIQSIRAGEANATLPSIIEDLTWHRRFRPVLIGGEGGLRFQTHAHYRSSNLDFDSADADTEIDGRDVVRNSLRLDWRRNWVLPTGIVGSVLGEVATDFYVIGQDATAPATVTRIHPTAAVELRWPWVRAERNGASNVIEPIAQLAYSATGSDAMPNEDSRLVEFDEGNLFSLDRFPGSDSKEHGLRGNLGISWTRYAPSGWSLGAAVGRVLRAEDRGQFGAASGLDGSISDWLAALQLSTANGFNLTNRALFDDTFDMTKNELRMGWETDRYGLSSSYIWTIADLTENRPDATSELTFDGNYRISDRWSGRLAGRYDFVTDRTASAGVGLGFVTDCLKVDLSLSRRFTSSTSVTPSTDFGLSVDLVGFGSGRGRAPARSCRP